MRINKTLVISCAIALSFLFFLDASHKRFRHFASSQRESVLITGGCGFVGRHFAKRLCEAGMRVVIVDDMSSLSSIEPDEWPFYLKCSSKEGSIEFFRIDCRDYFRSASAKSKRFSLFIHLAAVVGGRSVIENSPILVAEDLSIDSEAFKWAVDNPDMQMVYFSSSAAYPVKLQNNRRDVLLKENMINLLDENSDISRPDLTYGWAKLTGEYLSLLAYQKHGLNVAVYRPMSGYGEDQHESYPFKAILKRAFNRENPLSIWSNATRDFVHIDDIVSCVLKTMSDITPETPLNLASGTPVSFHELSVMAASEMGYDARISVLEGQPKGVDFRVGDSSHFNDMGCTISIPLREGVKRTLRYLSFSSKR